jgi:RNA polymerase sigma-70 factor (ECF subfamily)
MLKPQQKLVLEMGLLRGLSHSEIAAATGMPLGTVKTQMRRGLIKVREIMNVPPPGTATGGEGA